MLELFWVTGRASALGAVARAALLGALAAAACPGCSNEAPYGEPGPNPETRGAAQPSAAPPAAAPFASAVPAPPIASAPTGPTRPVPSDSRQLLLVTTSGWNQFKGTARRYERSESGSEWHAVGRSMDIVTGRRGMAWGRGLHPEAQSGPVKHEGDGRSPAGVFDLGHAYGYASAAPEGTTWPYARLTVGWRCVDEPRSEDYNTFLLPEGPSAEASLTPWDGVRRDVVFDTLVWVKHNADPVLRGAGSCVLLHVWINPATPTQGCTGMSKRSIHELLAWLAPSARPVLVQLPDEVRSAVGEAWGVPH
jgi:L,D-peptidoglycan transpeptidase YkuD (ErfK/YbiS/YcfS/YnhG family)